MERDELELILPRRSELLPDAIKYRVKHALEFIANKIRKNARTYDTITIGAAELSASYRGTGIFPCQITNTHLQWYLREAGYNVELIDGNRLEINWGKKTWE